MFARARRDRHRERPPARAGPAAGHRRRARAHQPGPARRDHPEHLRRRASRSRTCPELIDDDPDEVERRVERAIDSLHLTIRDIRNFIFGLRPELLGGTTLLTGLAAIVEEFRHNSMIDVELRAGTMVDRARRDDDRPPAGRRQRGAQSNIARHSGAHARVVGSARARTATCELRIIETTTAAASTPRRSEPRPPGPGQHALPGRDRSVP